jgi:uncharacterized protein YbdZ (MbtH family)
MQQSITHSMIIYNGWWVGAKQQSLTHSNDYLQHMLSWCLTAFTQLMIIYNRCWVGAKQQSLTHSMIIYNGWRVGAKQQSITHSNDYLQQMLSCRLSKISIHMIIYVNNHCSE